ncbi:TPA: PAS domain S-box protein [Methanosarcina acetivorans]|uniref:Sensory transduction histidine kinase n=2 Tax=Methanosarcina acetivorans TaxID=2214 RepID=Q8TT86_METAC|nr:PAS domain S-box protein [Methanosarcina acetivorans]AAM03995.1 sensory transduction histidine kinase [Methanosarcina acetivorans C2A]HIH94552.1 PAS domain S-box protein [Methanosarcina acetivorans]
MKESLRKSGIDIIGEVPWGTHFCQFYHTEEDLMDTLVPYFKAGLENNELCVWIISQPLEVEDAKEAMKRVVPDIDVYLEKGQIEIIPYAHGYLKGGIFDPDGIVNSWVEKIDQALARGYDGLRAAGDNRWLEKEGWNGFVDYENKMDAIIDKHQVIALCPYYLDMCSTAEIVDVVSNHQFALIKREGKWERTENSGRKKAEKEAIQAAKNWKQTFDAVPDLIAIIDDKYRVIRTNRAMAERLGITPEECAGLPCYRVIHRTNSPPPFCPHQQLLKDGAEHTAEVCEALLGGNFAVIASPLHDSEGRLAGSVCVAHDINERKQEEHKIRRYNRILEGINRIFSNVVQAKTEEEVGNVCLSVALEVTGSEFGFINEMGADGLLHDVAKSELGWERCFMYDKTGHLHPQSDFAVHGLYGIVINNDKGFFTNDPQSHPDSRGLPEGHPPIRSFLGVPLVQDGKTIGLIAVANREGGYSCEQQEDLEAIAPAVVQVLQRKKAEQKRKQAEEALQISEERYRSLYENSLDGILLTKPDGTILCANPQACQMFGMAEDEIIRAGREGLVVNDEKLAAALEERKLTGRARAELTYRRKDGSTLVCDATSKLFVGADGNINTSQIIRDISERKQIEEALRASEEKFRQIVETASEGIWLIDSDERTVFVNRKMSEMLGYSIEEILGQSPRKFMSSEFRAKADDKLHKHLQGINQVIDYMFIRKDGSELWCIVSSSPFFDDCGKYAGSLGMITDITERKRVEEALRLSNLYNRSLIEAGLDPLVTIGRDGKIMDVNVATEHITGYSRNELIGTDFSEYFIDPEKARTVYRRVFTDGEVRDYPLEIQHKDGHITPVLYNSSVYRDEKGEVIGVFAAARDITERKKAEEALKEAHDNLEKLIEERTMQLEKAYNSLKESEEGLAEAQRMAHIGNWDWELINGGGYWSDELYRIFGRSPQKSAPSYDELLNYIHPDDRDYVDKSIRNGLKEEPKGGIDYRIILADGEERTVHSQAEIIFDEQKNPVRVKGIVQDITERKRIEAELELVARLSQENPDPVMRLNQGLIINYANPSAQVLLKYWGSAIGKEAPEEITEPSVAALGDGIRRKLECTYANRIYMIDIAPFTGAGYVNLYAHDITESKEAKEALEKIDKIRIKEIHHRIKNNLQVISSLLDLQAEKFQNKEVLEAFRESQNRVTSMSLIHEELYKGGENNTLNFSTYLQKLAENLFQTYSLKSKKVLLCMDLEENTLFDMDIAVPLGIIVNELVSNSLKHAFTEEEEGEIRIKLCREEKGNEMHRSLFSLSISDNGKGIPESTKLESIESLGLQLVSILVDQLDGKIELKRTHGTEFRITFNVTERP